MDKETRSAIERATQRARRLLEEDFSAQLEGEFDVQLSGIVAANAGSHLDSSRAALRERIVAAIEHKRAAGMSAAETVADYLRDTAFTALNRFVALKMLEARQLVQECISKGEDSAGYREFCGMAPGLPLLLESAGYRLYIESLFDELSTEIKVLFDRRDPASVLWPRRATFEALLDLLNGPELAGVWGEDETIGWVYQYFNGADERRKMREESQAPKNSRELAVRNQFFTPRYVVEFLVDNTLGRIWCEMHGSKSALSARCKYLVKGQDGFLNKRPKKDPRDIRILDPACGSGHFLLYAFELLLLIYEEAWCDTDSPSSVATGRALSEDFVSRSALRSAVPELVLLHNLHGVDIDARCAQIAQLSLWMRAQRAYLDFGLARSERPRIRRSHVVIAEPLIADRKLLETFLARLADPGLGRVFTQLVGALERAGELGLLIRLENHLGNPRRRGETDDLFAPAEERIRAALELFEAEEGARANTRRRLFAEDATEGMALLDAVTRNYDIVLMNPPFGETTATAYPTLKEKYPSAFHDLLATFIQRAIELGGSAVGALASEACLYGKMLSRWRKEFLLPRLELLADLGDGVLDSAVVRAVALVLVDDPSENISFIDATTDKTALAEAAAGHLSFVHKREVFEHFPHASILFRVDPAIRSLFFEHAAFEPTAGSAKAGLTTYDDERFVRLIWEVNPASLGRGRRWVPIAKGGNSETFYPDTHLVVLWEGDGREMGRHNERLYGGDAQSRRGSRYHFRSGLTFGRRAGRWFAAKPLNPSTLFTDTGPAVLSSPEATPAILLGYLNSDPVRYLLHAQAQGGGGRTLHIEPGLVKQLPWPNLGAQEKQVLTEQSLRAWKARVEQNGLREQDPYFFVRRLIAGSDIRSAHAAVEALVTANDSIVEGAVAVASAEVERVFGLEAAASALFPPREQHRAQEAARHSSLRVFADAVVSACVGMAFGRFELSDPGAEAPADPWSDCFPLVGQYDPHRAAAKLGQHGIILDDDPGSPSDIVTEVSLALSEIGWTLEELAQIQGCELRRWLANRYFPIHLQQYSRSRRKAPIYWQLATPSASYSVWIYLHALTDDTLFRIQHDYLGPKLERETRRLEAMPREERTADAASRRKALAAQEALVNELRSFLDEVRRVAPLWRPRLDDGAALNFSLLWRLAPQHRPWQKDLEATWNALCDGQYDWAHLALHLWPERVVPKCATDRSFAIAHKLEEIFWVEDSAGRWTARKTPTRPVEELVRERTSPAVKAALQSLLEAPPPTGSNGARKGGRRRGATAELGEKI